MAEGGASNDSGPDPVPVHDAQAVLMRLLVDVGVPEPDVHAAADGGTLHLLALERLVNLESATYSLDEVAAMAAMPADRVRNYWRALGFPEPRPHEKIFSDTDVEMLGAILPFVSVGDLEADVALQMARVIGSSLARIANAQIEVIEREVSRHVAADMDDGGDGGTGVAAEDAANMVTAAEQAAELLPMMPRLMEFVWRRHLGAAARRRIVRAAGEEEFAGVCVGFADMVGFTAQTQQLRDEELADVVSRFETTAYDVVSRHGGRVVKMIGDEVMFTIDGAAAGAELALHLADAFREDDALSDVRVGLAAGSVLEREGDVYGPVVNLASRIVSIAYPASVVVDQSIVDALADDATIDVRSIRSHYLKDIGRVALFTLRWIDDDSEPYLTRARSRRADRRRFVVERRLKRAQQAADLAEEVAGELVSAAEEMADGAGELVLGLHGDLPLEAEFVEDATTGELEALTEVVLAADIADDLQVELLADIEAARRLQAIEEEAQAKAVQADLEAERKLDAIEEEARRKVAQAEFEARIKVEQALREAEDKARRANEEASRKVKRVAEETERKVDRAERDAQREAERRAAKARAERERAERERIERERVEQERAEQDRVAQERRDQG